MCIVCNPAGGPRNESGSRVRPSEGNLDPQPCATAPARTVSSGFLYSLQGFTPPNALREGSCQRV